MKAAKKWDSRTEHDKASSEIIDSIGKVADLTFFTRSAELPIICDASWARLSAGLQQREKNDKWKPIHFASRFPTEVESKYSNNESTLLAVVCYSENFRNYVNGTEFQLI